MAEHELELIRRRAKAGIRELADEKRLEMYPL
jgi:hypothetical protein